jgi:DNA-directed RNA polymerase specialized sigma24 family protein
MEIETSLKRNIGAIVRRPPDPAGAGPSIEQVSGLVERTLHGDEDAWHKLWLAIEPTLLAVTSRWRITSRLSRREDDRRNIVVQVMGRLRADRFRRLRRFHESVGQYDPGSFRPWLATVAARSAISYVRTHAEYRCPARGTAPDVERWTRTEPIASEHGEKSNDPTRAIEARILLDRAPRHLRSDQLDALRLWLEGCDHAEIAARLGLMNRVCADRLVRSGLKRLRDRIGGKGPDKIDHCRLRMPTDERPSVSG